MLERRFVLLCGTALVLALAACELNERPEEPPQPSPERVETRDAPVTPPEAEVTRDFPIGRDTQVAEVP